jgi:uncharacterized membrane protein YfcA
VNVDLSIALSALEIIVAVSTVAVGAALQGSVGYGLGLVAAPILVLVDPMFVPGPLLLTALVFTILVTRRERQSMDLHGLKWALLGRVPGVVVGAATIVVVSRDRIALAFGVLIVASVGVSILVPRIPISRGSLFGAGVVSGFLGTTVSTGGPPMALLYQHAEGNRIRATLAGYFTVGVSMSLASLAVVGRLGAPELVRASILLPGAFLGFAVSRPLATVLDRGRTRGAILLVSLVAGLAVILRQLV